MPPLSFEQIVKRSTKATNPPKAQSVPRDELSRRERQVIQFFRSLSDSEKRNILAILKMAARHTDGPTPKE